MGGFGALDEARLDPSRFCAVGAHSPALWLTGGSTPAGAFDDAQDFARHDLVHLPFPFHGAVGHGLQLRVSSGGNDSSYWTPHMAAYLRFYAEALRSCRR
jgi:S-formylglutathione hydrolase FrmB